MAVEVRRNGAVLVRLLAAVAASAPAIYANQGTGQAAAINDDGKLNSAAHPARPGSAITLYATGEGQTQPAGVDGRLALTICPTPVLPVSVTIGGLAADILFAGSAAGFAGLMEVDLRIPLSLLPGQREAVLTVGPERSQPGVTIAVR